MVSKSSGGKVDGAMVRMEMQEERAECEGDLYI